MGAERKRIEIFVRVQYCSRNMEGKGMIRLERVLYQHHKIERCTFRTMGGRGSCTSVLGLGCATRHQCS